MLVWLPAALVSMLLNLQVYRLGTHHLEIAGGTPNYLTRLLKKYPYIATYGAIGYLMGWVSVPPINGIILTELIKSQLTPLSITCPETFLKIIFTVIPFILAFSNIRASSILHLFFVLPAIGLLITFSLQGLGWLALSPVSPGFFPEPELWSAKPLHFVDWAKWFFIAIYGAYAGETASSFVADSKNPQKTLNFLKLTTYFIPIVYLGGSWVLMRLDTGAYTQKDTFLNLLTASSPFWGQSAGVLVTFLIVTGAFLSSATAVSNSPRIFYQLAIDGYLSPVFGVLSHRGVFFPSLIFTLFLSLICLIWGDVSRIIMVTGTSYVVAMIILHLGIWLHRHHSESFAPWWSLGIGLIEIAVLLVGGWAWGWQDWTIGIILPIAIMIIDFVIRRIPLAPFRPRWWIEHDTWWGGLQRHPLPKHIAQKDFIAIQVIVLLLLVCSTAIITWVFRGIVNKILSYQSNNLFVILLISLAFVSVAIACWTSLPQVTAVDEARQHAENLFITALDTVPDSILVVDENGFINQANPSAELLFEIEKYKLLGQKLNHFLPGLSENTIYWENRSEQILKRHQKSRIIEATISQRSGEFMKEYIIILRDITENKQANIKLKEALQTQAKLATTATAQAQQLEVALSNLQKTQAQLVQTEKMSSLGQLVAGIAHEINNPISFINGNLQYFNNYSQSLVALVKLYQQKYPQNDSELEILMEEHDLTFIIEDLPKTLSSMKVGTNRIREIIQTLRNFSRIDESEKKFVDIHEGIDSTLLLLQHRLQGQGNYPSIEIIKIYGDVPKIACYAGQLNQVFMNILSNAIDALQEDYNQNLLSSGQIIIHTQINDHEDCLMISIKDNGKGMNEEIKNKLFDPFFTTKPVGSGTGLGLSICYQIVVNQHKGNIICNSLPDYGSEFIIEIPIIAG